MVPLLVIAGVHGASADAVTVAYDLDGVPTGGNALGVSNSGKVVVFSSPSDNVVTGDTNADSENARYEGWDVFVRDRDTCATTRVSVGPGGVEGDGNSGTSVLSGDGQTVVFTSNAPNLVANDTNGEPDVFVHDRRTGVTERASVSTAGEQGFGPSGGRRRVAVSDDGSIVAFQSIAHLVPGLEGQPDTPSYTAKVQVYVRDRAQGTTTAMLPEASAALVGMSGDGSLVAVRSLWDISTGGTSDHESIYLIDRTGTVPIQRVPLDAAHPSALLGRADATGISDDGCRTVFTAIDPMDFTVDYLELYDCVTGTTQTVLGSVGLAVGLGAGAPAISPDGRWAAFRRNAPGPYEYTTSVVDLDSGAETVVQGPASADETESLGLLGGAAPTVVTIDAQSAVALVSSGPIARTLCEEIEGCERLDDGSGPAGVCLLDLLDGIPCEDTRTASRLLRLAHRARRRLAANRVHGARRAVRRALRRLRRVDQRRGFACREAYESILQGAAESLAMPGGAGDVEGRYTSLQ